MIKAEAGMQRASFTTSAEDLLAVYRLHLRSRFTSDKVQRKLIGGAIICAVLALAANWFWRFAAFWFAAGLGAAYWLIVFSAIFGVAYLRLPRQSRNIFVQQKALHGTTTVEWSDRGVTFSSPKGNSQFEWIDFLDAEIGKETIVLRQSDAVMNFIPTRALTFDQLQDLKQKLPQ